MLFVFFQMVSICCYTFPQWFYCNEFPFYSSCNSFKLLCCRIEISFYILKFICLCMYVCMYLWEGVLCVMAHGWTLKNNSQKSLFFYHGSPETWAQIIRLDDQHLYFLRHLPGMKIEISFNSSMKFPALWLPTLLPSRLFPFNPIRWMTCLNVIYHASRHFRI